MPIALTPQQIVDSLRIASPCEVSWSSMTGDDRARHCAQCDRKVYNVAQMSAQEVVDLIQSSEQMPCLQLWRRADGTVITADCPVGVRRLCARRRAFIAATVLSTLLAACGGRITTRTTGLAGQAVAKPCPDSAPQPASKQRTMGKVAIRPHQAPSPTAMGGAPMPPSPSLQSPSNQVNQAPKP